MHSKTILLAIVFAAVPSFAQSVSPPSTGGGSGSGTVNSGAVNQLAWYAATGPAVSGLATANSGVLVTSGAGAPSISTTLPNGIALGTPASGTLTNATGLPVSSGISGLGTNVATWLATPSGANLASALTTALPNTKGGTGTDSSASTGFAQVSAGAWSFASITASQIPAVALPTPGSTCSTTGNSTFCVCTTTCTITVGIPAAGQQYCAVNDDNVSTVITLSAIGNSARYENTARTAYGTAGTGTLVSAGAVGDMVCIVGRDSTHYLTLAFKGTWTAS